MPLEENRPPPQGRKDESTRFRISSRATTAGPIPPNGDAPRRNSDIYVNANAKSMRFHARFMRSGLATRLAVPIIVAIIIGFTLIALVARNRVALLQIEDLKADAVNSAFVTGIFGRLLITNRDRFIEENPEYRERAEWLVGDHWLVKQGFVKPDEWAEAVGFDLGEYAPAEELERAAEQAVLVSLSRYLDSPGTDSGIVGVFILNPDGTPVAEAERQNFRFNPLAVKSVPPPKDYLEVGGMRIMADYIHDIEPEPLIRGIARIMDADDPDKVLGSVVVILHTRRHSVDLSSFLLLLADLGLALVAWMAGVCWYSARKATEPIRRMVSDMQAIAEGDYTRRSQVRAGDELGLLSQAFNSMAERLRIARLNEQETNRLESDLAIAREIQNNLLPTQTPRVRGLDMYTAYRPAREIGGDYFDFLPVDDRHIGMVIADASGKSVPAALVMSTTRAILRFVAPGNASASKTLTRVNAVLSVDIPKGMFVTAYYLIFDPLDRSMLCASAGHNPLLLARADDSVELLNPGGIALGFDTGPIFQRSIREQRVKLHQGDRVLLYTDGVVECVNTANEEYSDRRLREFLRRNRNLDSHDFVGALMADLDRHRGAAEMRDDTTILTFKVL